MIGLWSRLACSLCLFALVGCAATTHTAMSDDDTKKKPAVVAFDQEPRPHDKKIVGEIEDDSDSAEEMIEGGSVDAWIEFDDSTVRATRRKKSRTHPRFTAVFGYAVGKYDHETRMSGKDDNVAAGMLRARTEFIARSGFGVGGAVEIMGTDDELFNNVGVTDGEASSLDIYPYAIVRLSEDEVRMPLRIGPFYHGLRLEDNTLLETTWSSLGARIEIEPEITIFQRGKNSISMFAELGGAVHVSNVEVDTGTSDQDFHADGYQLRGNAGLRGTWSGFTASLSYIIRYHNVDKTDSENGVFVSEIDTHFRGIFFEGGFRF